MTFQNTSEACLLRVFLFISKIRYPKYPAHIFPLYMNFMYRSINKNALPFYLDVVAAPSIVIKKLSSVVSIKPYFDDFDCVSLISKSAFDTLKLCENDMNFVVGNLLEVFQNKIKLVRSRVLCIFPCEYIKENQILISECTFSNLAGNSSMLPLDNLKIRLKKLPTNLVPDIANKVEISLVNNHFEVNHSLIANVLFNYFKKPKFIHKNGVFEIDIKKYAPKLYYSNKNIHQLEKNKLYFKCLKIVDKTNRNVNCGFCINGETELSQKANTQSFAPKSLTKDINLKFNSDISKKLISCCPSGLDNYFQQIESAFLPFMKHQKLHFKPAFLIKGNKGSGKTILIDAIAKKLGLHLLTVECSEFLSATPAQTETKIRTLFLKTKLCAPCIIVINNFENFAKDQENQDDLRLVSFFENEMKLLLENNIRYPIFLVCISNSNQLSPNVERIFLEIFSLDYPTQTQREMVLKWLIQEKNVNIDKNVNLEKIAIRTHSFVFKDLEFVVKEAWKTAYNESVNRSDEKIVVTNDHFSTVLDIMQTKYSDSIGAPKVPQVYWSDIGGLSDIKNEILKTINLPLHHKQLLQNTALKRSGLLLYGPPGTGKTLIAKAVATECSLNFLSVKGPELLNMYVGQSELNVRQVFNSARQAAPCIIFFDELDSLAPNRGLSGDSGGVMDRVVSQLLAEMDGLNDTATIFIIGATNRPDLIDPALLRPGRFDKLLYVGVCQDFDGKLCVLKTLTKKLNVAPDLLDQVVENLPLYVTGADLQAVCSNAWLKAARRKIHKLQTGKLLISEHDHNTVVISLDDFKDSIKQLKPSVSPEELLYFEKLKLQFNSNIH